MPSNLKAYSIPKILATHRKLKGLKQSDVAKMLQVSKQAICNIERGKLSPCPAIFAKYCKICGLAKSKVVELYMEYRIDKLKLKLLDKILQEVQKVYEF